MPMIRATEQRLRGGVRSAPAGALSRRRTATFRNLAKGTVAATLLWALPAQAAEKISTVLQQMRDQLEEDQRQINALRRQLEGFQKRLDQTVVTPPPGVPPREARSVVVTQQPGNLPGRSVG